jgi:hypothetical protein
VTLFHTEHHAKKKPSLARGWAAIGQLGLSQPEERQDRENNDDQTDDVDDVVHG